ncbi:MAG: hypothetical protein MJ231_05365 [bacterium]|nr:hypothetical protein [bacterium]
MRINHLAASPNFGQVLKANTTFSDTQMDIAKDIKNKMNTVYDGHFNGKTPNNWLEDRNCDTLILSGSSDKSVKFCVTSRANDDPTKRPTVKQYYIVGEYSENNPFYVNDIKEANKSQNMITTLFLTVALSIFAMIGLMMSVNKKVVEEKMVQEKEAIVDSLKNVIKNDTIAPFKVK